MSPSLYNISRISNKNDSLTQNQRVIKKKKNIYKKKERKRIFKKYKKIFSILY
jgi:hypothetical protein